MHIPSRISALALAAALASVAPAAHAQLSLGVDLDAGSGEGLLGLGVGVDLGLGDNTINVDAGLGLGGDSLVDADLGVGASSGNGGSAQLDVGAEVLGDDGVVDADIGIGTNSGGERTNQLGVGARALSDDALVDVTIDDRAAAPTPAPAPAPSTRTPTLGVTLAALDDTARVDAIIGQIRAPQLGDGALDSRIDDRRVSILALADLLDEDGLADVRAEILTGGEGRDDLLAAVNASVKLGAILDRQGIALEDVVSLSIAENGRTEVIILGGGADLAEGDADDTPLLDTDLAALDIDLLTDDELAEIDLALLPNEDQRLDAIVRLLGNGDTSLPSGGEFEIVAIDALLGEEALADVDAVLGARSGEDVLVTAELLDALDGIGLSPDAVVGVDTSSSAPTRVFVNAGLREAGLLGGDLASIDLTLGSAGGAGGGDGDGGTDPGDGDGGTDPGDGGTDPGDGGTDPGDGGTDPGDGGTDPGDGGTDPGDGGTDPGTDPGTGGGNGDDGSTGGGNGPTTPTGPGVTPSRPLPTGDVAQLSVGADADGSVVVADIGCALGVGAMASGASPAPAQLQSAESLVLVTIDGCVTALEQREIDLLRAAITLTPGLSTSVEDAGLNLDDLVGGTLEGSTLTLFFDPRAQSVA